MRNTYPVVLLRLMTLKDYEDRELATKVIRKITEYGKDYCPDVYGEWEPLKKKFDPQNTSDVIRLWMNEANNKILAEQSYATGSLLMDKRKKHKVSYSIRWQKYNQARFNLFSMVVDLEYLNKEDNYNKICATLRGVD